MPTNITIQMDANRIRLIFVGDVDAIESYLESKNYTNTAKLISDEHERIRLEREKQSNDFMTTDNCCNNSLQPDVIIGTECLNYNFVWESQPVSRTVRVDFVHPINEHHTDEEMPYTLSKIIEPLGLTQSEEFIAPNNHISDLVSNTYLTIFQLDGFVASNRCVSMIAAFERVALQISRTSHLSSVSRVVTIQNHQDEYIPGIAFFGSTDAAQAGGGAAGNAPSLSSCSAPPSISAMP